MKKQAIDPQEVERLELRRQLRVKDARIETLTRAYEDYKLRCAALEIKLREALRCQNT